MQDRATLRPVNVNVNQSQTLVCIFKTVVLATFLNTYLPYIKSSKIK